MNNNEFININTENSNNNMEISQTPLVIEQPVTNNPGPQKKKGKGKTIVIILLVLIILGICGYILYDKGIIFNNNIDNNLQNKDDNKQNQIENNDNKKIDDKLAKEMQDLVLKFPYADVAETKNIDLIEPNNTYNKILDYGIQNTQGCCYTVCVSGYVLTDKCKQYIKEYEDFDKNKVFYSDSQAMSIYNTDDILKTIKQAYKDIKLFSEYKIYLGNYFNDNAVYLKDINKIIKYSGNGGVLMAPISAKNIFNSTLDNDTYKIQFVESIFKPLETSSSGALECNLTTKDGFEKISDCNKLYEYKNEKERKEYILANKDKLPQYEVSFKINNDNTFEYINVVRIN